MSSVETAVFTVLIGVTVYVLGKIIERAFIEPLNDYRRLVMEIAGALAVHARYWANPPTNWLAEGNVPGEAAMDIRAKGAQLGAYAITIPWYRLWSLLHLMPKRGDLLAASSELIGISNRLPPRNHDDAQDNTRAFRHVQELLRMAVT